MKRFGNNDADSSISSKRLAVCPPFGRHSFRYDRWKHVTRPIFEGGVSAGKLEEFSLVCTKVEYELTVQFASKERKVGGFGVICFAEPTNQGGFDGFH